MNAAKALELTQEAIIRRDLALATEKEQKAKKLAEEAAKKLPFIRIDIKRVIKDAAIKGNRKAYMELPYNHVILDTLYSELRALNYTVSSQVISGNPTVIMLYINW